MTKCNHFSHSCCLTGNEENFFRRQYNRQTTYGTFVKRIFQHNFKTKLKKKKRNIFLLISKEKKRSFFQEKTKNSVVTF